MGAVIKQWILSKLGLPMPECTEPGDLRRGLSNGHLLAEILRKYNYISDDQLIALGRNFSEKTRLKNMRYVERWMKESGFDVSFAELLDIVEEKPGAVIKFLYRLYFLLEGSALQCQLDDPNTILQEKHRKPGKSSKKPKKPKKPVEPDLQVGTRLAKAVNKIKKCMIQQMCAKDTNELAPDDQDEGPRSGDVNRSNVKPPCPCACACRQVLPEESTKPKCKTKSQPSDCVDTQKYFTKKTPSCGKSKQMPVQAVLEPCTCFSPETDEISALKKLMKCPQFSVSSPEGKGDAAEGANLYFVTNAILRAREEKRRVIKSLSTNSSLRIDRRIVCHDSSNLNQFKHSSILEQQKFERLKAKVQAEYRLAKEMESYDDQVQDPQFPNPAGAVPHRAQNQDWKPIQPSFRIMQSKMQKIKCNRKEEAENVADRARLRKALCARMIKEIPCTIYEDLMDTAMKKAMTLCTKEAELADFLMDTYREKNAFFNHMKYEESSLQRIRSVQEDNLALNRHRQSDLKKAVAQTAARHNHRMTYETLVARQEAEAVKNKKIVQDILATTVDIVTKICQYRSATGSDPPKGLLQEWKASMFLYDTAPIMQDRSGAEVDMLDQLRLDDYLMYQGEWNLPLPTDPETSDKRDPPPQNEVLKKIVNTLMEDLNPTPKAPRAKKEPIQATGVFALCGVEFVWKEGMVSELLQAALPDYQFEVIDTATTIKDAILLYAGSLEQATLSNLLEGQEDLGLTGNEVNNEEDEMKMNESQVVQDLLSTDEQLLPEAPPPTVVEDVRRQSKLEASPSQHRTSDPSGKTKRRSVDKKKNKSVDAGSGKKLKKNGKRTTRFSGQLEEEVLGKGLSKMDTTEGDAGSQERGKQHSVNKKDKKKVKPVESTMIQNPVEVAPVIPVEEQSPTVNLVAETLLNSQPEADTAAPKASIANMDKGWEDFKNLGKLALDQLLQGKQVDDEVTGRILAEKMRHSKPGSVLVILNYPNALCQALHLENSVKDVTIDIPLCYHHIDSLIERYRQTWSEEAGDLLNLAMQHATHVGKNRSELFNKTEMRKCDVRRKSSAFHSFLDGLLIADVNFNDKLAKIIQEEVNVEYDQDDGGRRASFQSQNKIKLDQVPDRAEVLLHTAFLHLKRFYLEEEVAVVVPMNSDEDEYYATMAYVLQKTLAKRKQLGSKAPDDSFIEAVGSIAGPLQDPPEEESQSGRNSRSEKKRSSAMTVNETPSPPPSVQVPAIGSETTGIAGIGKGKQKKTKGAKTDEVGPKSSGGVASLEEVEEVLPLTPDHPRRKSLKKGKNNRASDASEGAPDLSVFQVASSIEEHPEEAEEAENETLAEVEEGAEEQDDLTIVDQNLVISDQKPQNSKGNRYQNIIAHIPKDALEGLGDFWMNLEATFITVLRGILANIRQHHDMLAQYAADFRDQFRELLERPDDRMNLVAEFQAEFNDVIDDVREDVDVKTELHARVDELLERLEAISEEKYAASKDEIFKALSEGFLEGETEIMVNFFVSLVRSETDRFCDTIQFINDFYKMSGLGMPDTIPWAELAEVDLLADLGSVTRKRQNEAATEKSVQVGDSIQAPGSKEQVLPKVGDRGSNTSIAKPQSDKGDAADETETGGPLSGVDQPPIPKEKPRKRSKNSRKMSNMIQGTELETPVPPEVPAKVTPPEDKPAGDEEEADEDEGALKQPKSPKTSFDVAIGKDDFVMPTSRSICATASTGMSWEFELFNPDAYYDDEDINIEDSDFYEDELTLDQISCSEEGDVDSWPDAGTLFDVTEEEYTSTRSSSLHETRVRRPSDRHRYHETETAGTEDVAEGEEYEGEEEHHVEDEDCAEDSSGHEVDEKAPLNPAPVIKRLSSTGTSSPLKLSPQGSQSSLPESFFLGDSFCDDSAPLSGISSGASCFHDSKEDLRNAHRGSQTVADGDEALSSCDSSSGQSCESEEEVEENRQLSKKSNKGEVAEEEGGSEEDEEVRSPVKPEVGEGGGSVKSKAVTVKGTKPGSKVKVSSDVKFSKEEPEDEVNPGEVFVESDGGNDYEDEAGEDFDFLDLHWKFKPKRTFMDMVLDSLEEAWSHFDTVVHVSNNNVIKVEDFMKESILKGSIEAPAVVSKSATATVSEVIENTPKGAVSKKKGNKKTKSRSIAAASVTPVKASLSVVPSVRNQVQKSKKHVKGTKRMADWEKSVSAEINRVKYQVAVIQARAVKELKQLKDIIVQVVSDAKVDASNFYIDELQSALMACEVFRFGIENETGVQAKIIIEKNRFSMEPDTWFKAPSPLPAPPLIPPSPLTDPPEEMSMENLSDEEEEDDEEEASTTDPKGHSGGKDSSHHSGFQDENNEDDEE